MSRVHNCQFRLLLIIDDLDRCTEDRIMGMLHAVNFLLEPGSHQISPYICILAIDPRVVLRAIEEHYDPNRTEKYHYANVNG